MAIQAGALDRVLEDCVRVLKAIKAEHASDRTPYAVDLRRLLETALVLRFGEYLQFLEKFGFLKLDRRTDILTLTRPGKELLEGKLSRNDSFLEDAAYHFGERLNEIDLGRSAMSEQVQPLDGRYLPQRILGSGALSRVSEGLHLSINQPIAIKDFEGLVGLYRGELTREAMKELRAIIEANASVRSEFVVRILDLNVDQEQPYMIAELCEGGNLRDLMDLKPIEPSVALLLFYQAALGLQAAHAQGLVHGDLKPENLLLTKNGNVKLSDIGFSQLAQSDSLSKHRAYVGYSSLGYLAPEMFRQDRTYTIASDIYAMGIILYELLVGRLPGRRSPLPSEVVNGLPKGIDDLFDRMAHDEQTERITSMEIVIERLIEIMELGDTKEQVRIFLNAPVELPIRQSERSDGLTLEKDADEHSRQVQPAAEKAVKTNTVTEGVKSPPFDAQMDASSDGHVQDSERTPSAAEILTGNREAGFEKAVTHHLNSDSLLEAVPSVNAADGGSESVGHDTTNLEDSGLMPLQDVEEGVPVDPRSTTQVSSPDSTSVLDSILED